MNLWEYDHVNEVTETRSHSFLPEAKGKLLTKPAKLILANINDYFFFFFFTGWAKSMSIWLCKSRLDIIHVSTWETRASCLALAS